MEGAKLSVENPLSVRDPVDVMSDGYQYSSYVQGSSTCCILVLDGTHINAANLGDSGFMIIRGLEIVYRTKEQQHSFNFPYQIGTGSADKPHHSQRIQIEVQPDDLIILGTVWLLSLTYHHHVHAPVYFIFYHHFSFPQIAIAPNMNFALSHNQHLYFQIYISNSCSNSCLQDGLWDNLFDEDIIDVVANAPSDPATIAQLIARQAHIVANDKDIISPFSKSARSNGYPLATGGKLDDITVLCGRVVLSYVDYGELNNNSGIEPMALAP